MKLAAVTSTPDITPARPKAAAYTTEWKSGYRSGQDSSEDYEVSESTGESAMSVFNIAMKKLNQVATNVGPVSPLTFQLKTTWDDARKDEKGVCIDKAAEACSLICDVIAPNAGQKLFQSCFTPDKETNYLDLVPLMQAYSNATTRNVKTQILNLYAYRCPEKTLQKIHEPYAKLTEWQIRRAWAHARECGPGSLVETSPSHRIRLPPAKLDHFLDFVNRPYFYQDVAFGARKLRLSSGEKITMPNVIRKVTRSTMVRQYLQFCEEEQFEALSHATLFRILKVSLSTEIPKWFGQHSNKRVSGFQRLYGMVDELDQIGLEKSVADELRRFLRDGKRYFKTEYQSHCQDDESQCPDHCRKFGLSDPNDPDFQEHCAHQHTLSCPSMWWQHFLFGEDSPDCQGWQNLVQGWLVVRYQENVRRHQSVESSPIMRAVNQECAKQDILAQNPLRQETKTSLVFWFPESTFLCLWLTRKARWHPEFIAQNKKLFQVNNQSEFRNAILLVLISTGKFNRQKCRGWSVELRNAH